MLKPQYIAIPLFMVFIALEAWWNYREKAEEYDVKDTATNIFVGLMSLFWGALFGLFTGAVYVWAYSFAGYKFAADSPWTWLLLFLIDDFAYYWFHRVSHESRLFWNFHVVHHSSNYYNLSVAVRQSWFGGTVHWIFYVPLMFLGFAPWMFALVHGLNLLYQFFIHTGFIGKLGWLEYVFNTPSHHRVHHGADDQYLDKNYGGVLIVWDRLFGTFVTETTRPRYGTITPLESHNPLWINTHAWAEMWAAMRERKTLRGKLRCIFGSPNMDF